MFWLTPILFLLSLSLSSSFVPCGVPLRFFIFPGLTLLLVYSDPLLGIFCNVHEFMGVNRVL